jgi:hypothetical protein
MWRAYRERGTLGCSVTDLGVGLAAYDGCVGRAQLLERTEALLGALSSVVDAVTALDHDVAATPPSPPGPARSPAPSVSGGPGTAARTPSAEVLEAQLMALEARVGAMDDALASLDTHTRPPQGVVRLWLPAAATAAAAYLGVQAVAAHRVRPISACLCVSMGGTQTAGWHR